MNDLVLPEEGYSVDERDVEVFPDAKVPVFQGTHQPTGTEFAVKLYNHVFGNLYIGGVYDRFPLPRGIRHVVNLAPEAGNYVPQAPGELMSFTKILLSDSDIEENLPLLDPLVAFVGAMLNEGPTLVHCSQGLNRSALVAALVLIRHDGMSPMLAISRIKIARSKACLCNKSFYDYVLSMRPIR